MSNETFGVDPAAHGTARSKILDAAAAVFQEEGFERATTDDIADRLGATKGRVYYYFRTKFDIYLAVYEEGMRRATGTVEPLATGSGTGSQRLTAMCLRHLENLMSAPGYHDVISQGVVARRSTALKERQREALSALNGTRRRYEEMFRDVVTQGMEDGTLRSGDARLAVRVLLSSMNSTAMWFRPREGQDAGELGDLAQGIVALVLDGLRPAGKT